MEYYYGNTMEDGAWYPYPDAMAPPAAPNGFSTPKRTRSSKTSANVDLTSPTKDVANGDRPMSPGRRVNKIQKQLEYYFSIANMNEDKFLREAMDESGWVTIDTLLGFGRMKKLGATKELVEEAAFHSTAIEIDPKNTQKIRMNKLWKQFVGKGKKSPSSTKKRSSASKARERERAKQKELNEGTIEAIVAAIEKKQERRERRLRERERLKEKARKEGDGKGDDVQEEATKTVSVDDSHSGNKKDDDSKEPEDEAVTKLIIKDQQQGDDDVGDPEGNDT